MVFFWKKACLGLSYLSSKFGSVLFVNLDPALNYLLHRMNNVIQQPMILNKWRGGLLTNWKFVFLRKIPDFKKGIFINTWSQEFMQNLRGATRLPSAVFTFNVNGNLLAVKEARTVNLPIFSLSDSTSDTSNILYPLPGNDDAVSSITFCSVTVSKAILVGRLAGMSKYMRYKKIHSTF
jgi:small subunit ribosomal protein S2